MHVREIKGESIKNQVSQHFFRKVYIHGDKGKICMHRRQKSFVASFALLTASVWQRRSSHSAAQGNTPVRSPLISDGKLLYIISKGVERPPVAGHSHSADDMHDDEDESSDGYGQIGSTWPTASFSLDAFDPNDGMRHLRTVGIKGPSLDHSIR